MRSLRHFSTSPFCSIMSTISWIHVVPVLGGREVGEQTPVRRPSENPESVRSCGPSAAFSIHSGCPVLSGTDGRLCGMDCGYSSQGKASTARGQSGAMHQWARPPSGPWGSLGVTTHAHRACLAAVRSRLPVTGNYNFPEQLLLAQRGEFCAACPAQPPT